MSAVAEVERLEAVLAELQDLPAGAGRELALEAVRLLADFYGQGLRRIVEILRSRPDGPAILEALARDELVSGLLLAHDLHPLDTRTRVEQALDRVRPYLRSHRGDVTVVGVEDGVVVLQLRGTCSGCQASAVTIRTAIERAVLDAAPEVSRIVVRDEHGADVTPRGQATVSPLRRWYNLEPAETALAEGEVRTLSGPLSGILLCRVGGALYAYESCCPRCGAEIRDGLAGVLLVCPGCGARFDVSRAGQMVDNPTCQLPPVPLLQAGGRYRVAVRRSYEDGA